jgi:hypothetical protein
MVELADFDTSFAVSAMLDVWTLEEQALEIKQALPVSLCSVEMDAGETLESCGTRCTEGMAQEITSCRKHRRHNNEPTQP